MKRILITILTIFYLLSGISISNVYYYCNSMQKIMLPGENSCCSVNLTKDHKQTQTSCCHSKKEVSESNNKFTISPIKCCDIHQKQIEQNKTSVLINSYCSLILSFKTEQYSSPQNKDTFISSILTNSSDPFTRINRPLLI